MQWFSIMLQILNLSMASKKISIPLSCLQKFLPPPLFPSKNFKTPKKSSATPTALPTPTPPPCGIHNHAVLKFSRFGKNREIFNPTHVYPENNEIHCCFISYFNISQLRVFGLILSIFPPQLSRCPNRPRC